jgi:hypothetical protein
MREVNQEVLMKMKNCADQWLYMLYFVLKWFIIDLICHAFNLLGMYIW